MDNPDSDKFYTLPEAFNVLGRERYGEEWTEAELGARNRPLPEPPPPRTFDAAVCYGAMSAFLYAASPRTESVPARC